MELQMEKHFFTISMLILITMVSCATPVGKIPESDFAWQEKVIEENYQEVYRRILNGFRKCKPGIAEGNLYTDIKEGHFDVYLIDVFGGKHSGVLGVIDLKSDDKANTIVRVGVQAIYDRPLFGGHGRYRKLWLKFAEGDLSCES